MDKKNVKLILNEIKKLEKKISNLNDCSTKKSKRKLKTKKTESYGRSDNNIDSIIVDLHQTIDDMSYEMDVNPIDFYFNKRTQKKLNNRVKKGLTYFNEKVFPFTITTNFQPDYEEYFDDFETAILLTDIDYYRNDDYEIQLVIENIMDLFGLIKSFNMAINYINVSDDRSLLKLMDIIKYNFVFN